MTAANELKPKAVDLRRACSAISAYAQGNAREAAIIVNQAGQEGRSFWIVVSLVWLICKMADLFNNPEALARLQQSINALIEMEDEEP